MNTIITHFAKKLNRFFENNGNIFNTGSWENNFIKLTDEVRRQAFIAMLEEMDEEFFHSKERKDAYLSKDRIQRTLTTTFGSISYTRRKYTHKEHRTSFYFIDTLLNLSRYQRVSDETQVAVLRDIVEDKLSYEKACRKFRLSKTTAYNLIQRLNPEQLTGQLALKISCDYLHVVADEDHVAIQDKANPRKEGRNNRYMLRQITLYTALKQVSKGRNQLQNRVVFSQHEHESIIDFCERVNTFIYNNYNIKHDTFVYGDGANWIKTLAEEIGTTFIIDQFHIMQALVRLCGGKNNTEARNTLTSYLKNNQKQPFFEMIEQLNPNMSEFKQRQVKYLNNNWTYYLNNFTIPQALVCCAEGINSHYFASRLSSRPMGFAISTIHKLGSLLAVAASNVNIQQFLSDNLATLTRKKETAITIKNPNKYLNNFTYLPILASTKSGTRTAIHQLIS
jgi:Uncharacterised protein family (UPF0236)